MSRNHGKENSLLGLEATLQDSEGQQQAIERSPQAIDEPISPFAQPDDDNPSQYIEATHISPTIRDTHNKNPPIKDSVRESSHGDSILCIGEPPDPTY